MSNLTRFWLIIAIILILIGCLIFGGVMSVLKWDFNKLSTSKFETNVYTFNEALENISVISNTANIEFVSSENIEVVCYEQENLKHAVSVVDKTLVVEINDTRKWYEHIMSFGTPKITVYLPQGEYSNLNIRESTGNVEISKDFSFETVDIVASTGYVNNFASASEGLRIKTSTGDIRVENIKTNSLDLSVSTGKVVVNSVDCEGDIKIRVSTGKAEASDVKCKSFTSEGSTGSITLKKVIASEKFSVKRSTGDIKLEKCDAAEIIIKTDTGSVKGTLLSEKIFIAKSDTGKVDVPSSMNGGRCEISTDTGNIKILIEN